MRAALGGNEGVNLVDDDCVDGAESVSRLRGEQQVERLGRGDEDVRRLAAEAGALTLGGVAGADADGGIAEGDAAAAGHVGNAGQRGAKIALHVHGEGLERGDVDDAAATGLWLFRRLAAGLGIGFDAVEHEPIKAPEEGGEGFAGSGGGQNQGALAAGYDRPAEALRGGGRIKDGAEPLGRDGVEAGEGVNVRLDFGLGRERGHAWL